MDMENFLRSYSQQTDEPRDFEALEATALYCPKCKEAVPVRKHLLLVLPEGDKYEYRCAYCAETVGTKLDER
jgi:hypothetical protein